MTAEVADASKGGRRGEEEKEEGGRWQYKRGETYTMVDAAANTFLDDTQLQISEALRNKDKITVCTDPSRSFNSHMVNFT